MVSFLAMIALNRPLSAYLPKFQMIFNKEVHKYNDGTNSSGEWPFIDNNQPITCL